MKNIQTKLLTGVICAVLFLVTCKDDDSSSNNNGVDLGPNAVGSFANSYLSANDYNSLVVEIAHETATTRPTEAAVNELQTFLQARLNKPNGISIVFTEVPDLNRSVYSLADIRRVESDYRTAFNEGSKATAFFFFANGTYDQNTSNSTVLGVAYSPTAMCVFQRTILDNTGGLGQANQSDVEEGVLKHEFGHILGLVNLGTALQSQHEDGQHPKHCDVEDCLMYFAIETGDFFSSILGGNVPQLDAQCISDLRANGGK